MATATPLAAPWTDGPLDDLSSLPHEVRVAIEAAEARIVAGTARLIPQEDVPAALAEIRQRKAG